jgi:hypothetical protein
VGQNVQLVASVSYRGVVEEQGARCRQSCGDGMLGGGGRQVGASLVATLDIYERVIRRVVSPS